MTIETYPDSQRVNDSIQVSVKNDLNELYTAVQSLSAGSGVVISSADTPGYLEDKLLAGTGITLTKATTGSGQTLTASTPFDVVSNEASLGTGSVDGEMRICADSGNRYRWSATYAKWSIVGVNIYSSAPSSTTYHIPTGTLVIIGTTAKVWTGTTFQTVGPEQLAVGDIIIRITNYLGTNFLEADGSAVSRTTYSDLYTRYGVTFGAGDGSTTFNLPDLRGYVLRGWDHGAGVDPDAASRTDRGDGTTGDAVGTKQDDGYKSHNHSYYSHGVGTPDVTLAAGSDYGWHTGTGPFSTGSSGGNETRMKNINVMYCIYIG